jgi:hypothetical protein
MVNIMNTIDLYKALGLSVMRDVGNDWIGMFGEDCLWELGIPASTSEECAFIHAMQQLRRNMAQGL